ncbi:DUF7288 family protein [Halorubrum vacuolatum]|uniref:Uncharacterized protein n=1 Tax=Halorubrum vacuolatum TaxID=63740 RepID=A0A238WXA3_HALVU|nr:hypothetical protein [Halorubrum vacuolatum]SNR51132.1 hypothetical protein SAMN06264855_11114 [Halorubrum vacuolatum]
MFIEHLSDRGQAHTLEAFVAALLLVTGLIFATQATAVTPLSASTSNQHVENQGEIAAADLLATTKERGDLKQGLLAWNESDREFTGATNADHYSGLMPQDEHPLSDPLDEAFDSRQVAFNIDVYGPAEPGETRERQRLVNMGEPSDNAATAATRVTLYTDDRLFDPDGDDLDGAYNGTPLGESDAFFIEGEEDGQLLYAVVEVRITVWQL